MAIDKRDWENASEEEARKWETDGFDSEAVDLADVDNTDLLEEIDEEEEVVPREKKGKNPGFLKFRPKAK